MLITNKSHLSLVDAPYKIQNNEESVYTSAFDKSKKMRDGFIAKVRGNIYGTIRKNKKNKIKKTPYVFDKT